MRLPDGMRATNASKKISVFGPHFNRVFNNHCPVNSSVLQHLPQCCTMWELNDPITWEGFCRAIRKLKNAKALGLKGGPTRGVQGNKPGKQSTCIWLCEGIFHGRSQLWAVAPQPVCSHSTNWWSIWPQQMVRCHAHGRVLQNIQLGDECKGVQTTCWA